jgi:hypothetical protein
VSVEPHVRRLWPGTLISWARLLSGRFRDPLVGRDVLVGILGGVVLAVSMVLRFRVTGREPSELWVGPALESLGSGREFAFTLGYVLLDGIQYALGGLLCLLLLRLLLRKTWLAAACWMPLSVLLVAGTSPSGADLAAGALAGVLAMTMIFRIGLLANVVMLVTERLFTRLPLTLDPNAWYVGSSLLVLVVILAAATYGFRVALAGRCAFGSAAS